MEEIFTHTGIAPIWNGSPDDEITLQRDVFKERVWKGTPCAPNNSNRNDKYICMLEGGDKRSDVPVRVGFNVLVTVS